MRLRSFIHLSKPTRLLAREDRERLEAATRRSPRARLWSALIACGVAAAAALLFAYWLAVRTHWRLWDSTGSLGDIWGDLQSDDAGEYALAGIGGAMMFVAAAISFAVLAAKRRYMRLLRDRAACPGCGHGLGGLPLDESKHVRCPECEGSMYAVAAWNERGVDANGREVFVPATGLVRVWVSRRVVVRSAKWVGAAVALVLVVYGAWWGVREVRIQREARVAAADQVKAVAALQKAMGAKRQEEISEPRFWEEMARISAAREQSVAAATVKAEGMYPGVEIEISESQLWREFEPDAAMRVSDVRSRQATIAWFDQARGEEWFRDLDQLPTLDRTPIWTGAFERGELDIPYVGVRAVRDVQTARLHVARPGGADEFANAVNVVLALSDAMEKQRLMASSLTAWTMRTGLAERVLTAREHGWSAEELARIQALYEAEPVDAAAAMVDAEAAWTRNSLALHFSDVASVRRGVEDPTFTGSDALLVEALLFNRDTSIEGLRLGTYAENVAAADTLLDELKQQADMSPAQREKAQSAHTEGESDLIMIASLWDAYMLGLENRDAAEAVQALVVTALALERYRVEKGEYPTTLDALVPAYVREVPRDAMDREPLRYRMEGGRYTLWSIGLNGVDDGGVRNTEYSALSAARAAKHDMVVRSPDRAP